MPNRSPAAPVAFGHYVLAFSRDAWASTLRAVPPTEARSVLRAAFARPSVRDSVVRAFRGAMARGDARASGPEELRAALAWACDALEPRHGRAAVYRRAPSPVNGELPVMELRPPPALTPRESHYLDIVLVDQRGEPVPLLAFALVMPDGEERSGSPSPLGTAYYTTTAAGSATWKLPPSAHEEALADIVELELVTRDGKPAAHVAFELKRPDGSVARGVTDEAGRAVVSGLPEGGSGELSLLDLDESAWAREESTS